MRTSKFSEEQIIGFLRQAEVGMPIKEFGRKHGFSDASFYKWRSKYGGMGADPATSVVDAHGRSHDHPNLFIADASVFPSTGGGESPSLSIHALAVRTADQIACCQPAWN